MAAKKIRFINMRFEHHAGHSGYDRVAEFNYEGYATSTINVPGFVSSFDDYYRQGNRMRHRIVQEIAGKVAYQTTEARAAARLLRDSDAIYHHLYGEVTYKKLGSFAGFRKNKIVATLHLPPSQYHLNGKTETQLKKLSAIICVGSNQLAFFSNIVGKDRVFFVPLGIDVDYFHPPGVEDERDPNLCLCVGNLYRDFPTFRGVVEVVAYQRPSTRFVLVTSPKNKAYVGQHPNLEFRSGIPESELRRLYQSASLLVIPFYDGTANIAVTEAMACGLPVVSTDIGAIRDYVGDDAAILLSPFDSRSMADVVLDLLDDQVALSKMSLAAREQALKFSWPKMTQELTRVYDDVYATLN